MNKYVVAVQGNLRQSSSTFLLFFMKLLVGIVLGLTFALIGEEVFGYGRFLFFFVIVSVASVFLGVTRGWSTLGLSLFVMLMVMSGLVVRIYGLMAPAQ